MAKLKFPNRPCPKCGKPIHTRSQSHDCGWAAHASKAKAGTAGKPLTLDDIKAVKSLAEKIGVEKLRQLAEVLK